ncbi:MAG: hypothetical protein JW953_02750 [Anaerolineae bacterium]|nr:hypothetical protein [Anaerolineae bacterium]
MPFSPQQLLKERYRIDPLTAEAQRSRKKLCAPGVSAVDSVKYPLLSLIDGLPARFADQQNPHLQEDFER